MLKTLLSISWWKHHPCWKHLSEPPSHHWSDLPRARACLPEPRTSLFLLKSEVPSSSQNLAELSFLPSRTSQHQTGLWNLDSEALALQAPLDHTAPSPLQPGGYASQR